ncbi:ATP-dependent DNA helicase RecG [Prochlorococcus sp. MIT 1307]|uniref:ATP-dependent DNA helicase RecG n=1 Tax=Prochlorococcus sp. MIT 1307 TaxID=3096219 RepID=UPI0039BFBD40
MALEVEHGFSDLLGRDETFSSFMARQIIAIPDNNIDRSLLSRLNDISKKYLQYADNTDSIKRRLVSSTRQFLYKLEKEFCLPSQDHKLSLNIKNIEDSKISPGSISHTILSLSSPLIDVKGIGVKIAEKLASIGILSIKDLLQAYPRDYVDYSSLLAIKDLKPGKTATLVATVRRCNGFKSPKNKNLSILELHLQDKSGRIKVTRFFAGYRFSHISYLKSQIRLYPPGSLVAVSGMVKSGPYGKTFHDPLIEVLENKNSSIKSQSIGRLLPVYSLTEGLTAERFRNLMEIVLPLAKTWQDPLPENRLNTLSLPTKSEAIRAIHRPYNQNSLKAARRRLVFDEFLLLQLSLLRRRIALRKCSAPPLNISWERDGLVGRFLELLPFSLTKAQQRVLSEIESDLVKPDPMARLVQGDVGSGKTVVAIAALLNAVQSGWQGAFMAPTEVLAAQHYRTLCKWLTHLHVNVELLTGSTPRKQRRRILDDLSNGSLKILVGTHALIEDPVSFLRLGLVVVDEQHRFGVHQRNRLLAKGLQPHLLTMTATPIPRTLALSLHGDLDVSQIDELPPNRTPIKTYLLSSAQRERAYQLIRDEVLKGQRAYFVLPLVDESEKLDLRSAIEVYKQLTEVVFPEFVVGLLHGRMTSAEKQSAIQDFVTGKCVLLVSTTVVEVGVDVAEATVMVIDHADRFGLAQLHQLRGRVGRGAKTSHCLLINDSQNDLARQRLEVLVSSNDGFEISEIDLRLRGPGQVLGTRQSGLPDFALASLIDDHAVLDEARKEAINILEDDPELERNPLLKQIVDEHSERLSNKASLN